MVLENLVVQRLRLFHSSRHICSFGSVFDEWKRVAMLKVIRYQESAQRTEVNCVMSRTRVMKTRLLINEVGDSVRYRFRWDLPVVIRPRASDEGGEHAG